MVILFFTKSDIPDKNTCVPLLLGTPKSRTIWVPVTDKIDAYVVPPAALGYVIILPPTLNLSESVATLTLVPAFSAWPPIVSVSCPDPTA